MSAPSHPSPGRAVGVAADQTPPPLERSGPPAVPATPPPARAAGVELLGRLSGSGYRRTPGLVRRGDGQTLQLTPIVYALLDLLDGRRDEAALAERLGEAVGAGFEPDDVRFLLEERIRPLGLLAEDDGSAPTAAKANPLLALRCKIVITDPKVTRRITGPFARLFSPLVVVPALAAFAVTCWWVLFERGLATATREAVYQPGLLLTVFALTLASAAFHEFGHAAACRYGGATPGAMGAGLYLVWPAFYTDVDDSYRLGRRGRLRVDLGGLYFNALFAVAMAGLALATGQDALLLVVVTQLLQMARQLAPFMRADGYHILADLTGVPDLFAHIKPTLVGLWPTRWGRPEGRVLRPWARYVVTLWVVVVVPVLLGLLALMVYLLPRLAATAWHSAGLLWAAMRGAAEEGDPAGAAVRLLSLLALIFPVLAITYLLTRIVRRTSRSVWRATEGKPKARAAAVLGAALLVAAVGWAWWPNGQYTPVRADERGTLPSLFLEAPELQAPPASASGPVAAAANWVPLPGTTAVPAIALVPRTAPGAPADQHPTVLLTSTTDRSQPVQAILTTGEGEGAPAPGRTFPLLPPPEAGEGDNQSVAIGTEDGGVVYDISYALVWITEGEPVLNRNEAWALASCSDCTTVAVAFQVILVVGQSDTVVPINTAVAVNHTCTECATAALAVQLVATLEAMPDEAVLHELALAWSALDDLARDLQMLSVQEIYAALLEVELAVLRVLDAHGLLSATRSADAAGDAEGATDATGEDGSDEAEPSAPSTSPDAESDPGTATASPTTSPTASDSVDPTTSPDPTLTTSTTPTETATAEPSPSATSTVDDETSGSTSDPDAGAETTEPEPVLTP